MTANPAPRVRKTRLSREEQKAARGQALLAAAWEAFLEKGYEAVTIDEVAERAGYSRMPVYSLFGDKQTLFFELWRSTVTQLEGMLFAAIKPGVPLTRNLRLLAEAIASSGAQDPAANPGERLFFVVQTIALSRPDIAERLEALARKVVDDVAEIVRNSTLAEHERLRAAPEVIAAHLVAQINGLATVQFQTRRRYARSRELTAIFTAIALKDRDE
ncbi:TetR/AcrR family transcriptional regulator [Sinimarinibacterium thermocellulolyticum]|uniref:TetR/AcrR family transcriptional regulator n=1 Tax=Sinimarinibacterium thermocellulolyticum TaxID=3170016 RepID=A0ABV2ADD3_9GAMM